MSALTNRSFLVYPTGKLIGKGGEFVKSLKALSMCHIDIEKNFKREVRRGREGNWLPPQDGQPTDYQTVMLEGTRYEWYLMIKC